MSSAWLSLSQIEALQMAIRNPDTLSAIRTIVSLTQDWAHNALEGLKNQPETIHEDRVSRAKRELDKIMWLKDFPDPLFDYSYYNSRKRHARFARTAQYMGIPKESRLPEWKTHEAYYRDWIGAKLGYSAKDIGNKNTSDMETEMQPYLDEAIKFVLRYDSYIWMPVANSPFRSKHFEDIHLSSKTLAVQDYFRMWHEYELTLKDAQKQDTENVRKGESPINQALIESLRLSQWEIQRILAIAMRFRNVWRTPDAVLHELDTTVLTDKIATIFTPVIWRTVVAPENHSNALYPKTTTHKKYWRRMEDGSYDIIDTPKSGYSMITLEWGELNGKLNPWDRKKHAFQIEHIQIREHKKSDSLVEKSLRKPGSQVLDQAGIIFVLPDFKYAKRLIDMLVCELSIMAGAYVERLESVQNSQTGSGYKCEKCTIRIPHNFLPIKQTLESLKELHANIRKWSKNRRIRKEHQELERTIANLSAVIEKLDRDLFVEIQVFDPASYVAAELDKESSAFHEKYKERQRILEVFPLLYPVPPYDRDTVVQQVYAPVLARKYGVQSSNII